MKKIAYTRSDGGVSVVTPVIVAEESETEAVEREMKKLPEDATNVTVVDAAALPADRFFRNAWVQSGGAVAEDLEKSKALLQDRIRAVRKALFSDLDIAYQTADETGDTAQKQTIAGEKQSLRDATEAPEIVDAQSTDDLRKHWATVWEPKAQ